MKKTGKNLNIRIAGLILFAILLIILGVWLANNLLLEKVYLDSKINSMEKVFEDLQESVKDDKLYNQNFSYELEKICSNENLSVMVISSDGTVLITSQNDNTTMFGQFFDVMLERDDKNSEVLKSEDDYTISKRIDKRSQSEYLNLWGTLSDGNLILIRSAVQSMTDAARLSNRLLLIIGAVSLVVGLLLAVLVAKVISKLENDIMIRDKNERMRREFISNVSHELKTPLALIKGYAEGLAEGICENEEDRDYYIDVIIDETDKMSGMVSQLLSLNRLEYGQSALNICEFDIVGLIGQVLNSYRIMIEESEVDLRFAADNAVMVETDPNMCEQVIDNYLSNAIHYVDEQKIISIKLEIKPKKVRLNIYNSGVNIPEESLDSVWDKFYKVDEARTREYGGSGIGLSIVKAISETLSSECGVENRNNGVNFWFDFDKKY